MIVDSGRIKIERKKRAWSQEHFAETSGLGLRTIQRIESNGSASFESVKSICSVLSLTVSDLIIDEGEEVVVAPGSSTKRVIASVFGIALFSVGVAIFGARSFAEDVMLDIGVTLNDRAEEEGSLLTKNGRDAEFRLDDKLRFLVKPVIQDDGRILLKTKVFEYRNGDYVLTSEPELLIKDNSEAEIRMTMLGGDEVRLQVTPHAN